MKKLVKISVLTSVAFALVGCMSTTPKLAETRSVNLPDAKIMPTPEQVKSPGYRIVVSPVKYSNDADSIYSRQVYDRIESTLLTAGNKVIDRDLASNLQLELEAAEAAGRFNTEGVQPADIAVMATITGTNFKYAHTERNSWVDDDGDRHVTPAYCNFTANSTIDVRAYVLPTMQKVGNWTFEGEESLSTETGNNNCPISSAAANSLIADASTEAVESNIHELLTPLAPNFYILERRDGKEGSVFRTNLGSSKGAFEGAVVKISKIERIPGDEYTNEKLTRIELGEAEITKDVSTGMSYIYISDEKLASQIRRGHIVQLKHSECGVGESGGWLKGLCFNKLVK